jgi:hypothetical protein
MIAVSLVLFKTDSIQLNRCLNSINDSMISSSIFIIDNSPTDSLKSTLPTSVRYLHNPSNPGYGASHNIAILESIKNHFKYHLVLNADVYFDFEDQNDVLLKLYEYMELNPKVGHVMPMVLNPDASIQKLCKLIPSPLDLAARVLGRLGLNLKKIINIELPEAVYQKKCFVPYLSGCFMFLRVDTLKDVGLFDERFFMYPEDIDLTRRLAVKHDTIFFPDVHVYHEHGGASHKSIRMFLIHLLNMVRYFNKWGWFYDPIRTNLNKKALRQFK